jgi:hypothetical protein
VYDQLVQAGVEDMREERTREWTETAVVDDVVASPAGESDFTWPSEVRNTMLGTPKAEREDRDVVEPAAGSSLRGGTGEADAPPSAEEGYGFTWCLDCGSLERFKFRSQTLPQYFEGGEGERKCGIVLILCGICRRTSARVTVAKSQLESRIVSSFNQLRLGGQVFEGSKAVRAARAVMQRDVPILTNVFEVAYRDVAKIVQELGVDDQAVSVDLERFPKKDGQAIVLPFLRGGLVSSQTEQVR